MDIDWAALGQVFGVSLLATVALVGVFTLGIVGGSARKPDGTVSTAGKAGSYLAYALCAAAVAYGIYTIAA
ncbi:hypothetical protein JJV70_16375 [Streptomyces sp. JJ66]|uniref:hypothetical protein n=1 Tax=Streptomyces sp. JJ66 TaxID=2803843 RepID=UPI001C559951|nr:hypothetical protein [Streptomyces sp. JJ66]MBW1603653.1 hypothetical protein [Streptomyces sp. JJ66]